MSNICEELQLGMIYLFRFSLFHLTHMKRITQTDTVANHPVSIPGRAKNQ